jgi:hypothetical protein
MLLRAAVLHQAATVLAAADKKAAPPPASSQIGEHRDAAWWECVQTCKDPSTGKPTPELCSPLNPQPNHTWEVVAPQVGGSLDEFIYGANGTEWRQWMQPSISGGKVTAMPTFNARQSGFSGGTSAGFLCEAHRQGIRVMDSDTIDGIFSPFNLNSQDIFNETAMVIWAEAAAHFMVSAGIDGFSPGLLIQGVLGVPQDPFAPHRGPLGSSPDRERVVENAPALVPGPSARL